MSEPTFRIMLPQITLALFSSDAEGIFQPKVEWWEGKHCPRCGFKFKKENPPGSWMTWRGKNVCDACWDTILKKEEAALSSGLK